MWKEFISSYWSAAFYDPATEDEINQAANAIGLPFPAELRELYQETNGVRMSDAYMDIFEQLKSLVRTNIHMRSEAVAFYESDFTNFFFFGFMGNGDLLAFLYDSTNSAYRPEVIYWYHETGEHEIVATSLKQYIESEPR
jgi:hypothetical protein